MKKISIIMIILLTFFCNINSIFANEIQNTHYDETGKYYCTINVTVDVEKLKNNDMNEILYYMEKNIPHFDKNNCRLEYNLFDLQTRKNRKQSDSHIRYIQQQNGFDTNYGIDIFINSERSEIRFESDLTQFHENENLKIKKDDVTSLEIERIKSQIKKNSYIDNARIVQQLVRKIQLNNKGIPYVIMRTIYNDYPYDDIVDEGNFVLEHTSFVSCINKNDTVAKNKIQSIKNLNVPLSNKLFQKPLNDIIDVNDTKQFDEITNYLKKNIKGFSEKNFVIKYVNPNMSGYTISYVEQKGKFNTPSYIIAEIEDQKLLYYEGVFYDLPEANYLSISNEEIEKAKKLAKENSVISINKDNIITQEVEKRLDFEGNPYLLITSYWKENEDLGKCTEDFIYYLSK